MKIQTHSELIFTIFFRRDAAVKHLKDIFEEVYGDIDEVFNDKMPEIIYLQKMD